MTHRSARRSTTTHTRHWTEDEARAVLQRQKGSGLTLHAYAKAHPEAPYSRLLYWHKRLAHGAPSAFIQLVPAATVSATEHAVIRLDFHGVHLELREAIDPESLAHLVAALARTRTPC